MDRLEFTSKLIEHGAWPALATYVVVTQKEGIKTLLARMSKFKAPGMEAEFGAKTEAAAEKIDERSSKPVETPKVEQKTLEHFIQEKAGFEPAKVKQMFHEVFSSPTTAAALGGDEWEAHQQSERLVDDRLRASGLIIEEWANLEDTIRTVSARKVFNRSGRQTITTLIHELNKLGVISNETVASLKDLLKLRNRVAHTLIEPTREASENYATSCRKVEQRILREEAVWLQTAKKLIDEMFSELNESKTPGQQLDQGSR